MNKTNDEIRTDRCVFETAHELWVSGAERRAHRERLKRYTYGDQWGDIVTDSSGRYVREADILVRQGQRPVTNNLIRRLVKTIVGRYRDMSEQASWYDSVTVEGLDELDSRLLEEFLISGMAIQRVGDDDPMNGRCPAVRNVAPPDFFVNDFRDPHGGDIDIVGMLHDMSPAEARMRFAGGDAEVAERIDRLLTARSYEVPALSKPGSVFFEPKRGRRRVVEVWTRQYGMDEGLTWHCRWYAPDGTLLADYDSPWYHGGHPFALKFYPLTDGEVHPFVEDVIDQQRYINRLIVLIDRILATSAKGVLLFPVTQKPEGVSWEDIARRWSSADGIIPISGMSDQMPQQVHTSGGDANAHRLLELELRLFDEVSGVSSALLGSSNDAAGVTGANMYQARIENATIALADIFRTFRSMIETRNVKLNTLQA